MPVVSVIMPVYNAEKYLQEAIDSILGQTFHDFEFLIINDGSDDDSAKIINKYQDQRIRFIDRKHQGLVSSLNSGISISQGNYIARMDADDISLPNRFEEQVAFLDRHEDYGIIGCAYFRLNMKREIQGIAPVIFDNIDIQNQLLYKNPFAHSSVMLRSSILRKFNLFYRIEAKYFEDYDLWIRFCKVSKGRNLSNILYCWMDNPQNITNKHRIEMKMGALNLAKKYYSAEEIRNIFSLNDLWGHLIRSRHYRKKYLYFQNKKYATNFLSEYQYHIFSLAVLQLTYKRIIKGLLLLCISFVINPLTYIKQLIKLPLNKLKKV